MATVNSWIFKNGQGKPNLRYEGDIKGIDGLTWVSAPKGTRATKMFDGKQPCIVHEGTLYYGEPEVVWEQGADTPCNTNCKNAKGIFCSCSCKGKNHGAENRDMANAVRVEDVVYLGWEA